MLIIEYLNKIYKYKLIIFLFSITLLSEELINITFFKKFNLSIIEIVFLTIFIITVTLYRKKFIFFLISNPFRELFYFLFIFILLIKIFKTYLSNFSYINIYETIIWLYFYLFVCNLHFLIIKRNFDYSFFNDMFILTAFLSAFLIFISFILYNFGFDYSFLWETKKNVFQPYFGSNSLHFNGFFIGNSHIDLTNEIKFLHKVLTKL